MSWLPTLEVGTPLFRLAPALGEAGLMQCLGWSTEGPLGPLLGLIDQAGSPCHLYCATSDSLQPHYLVLRLLLSLSCLNQGTRSKAAAPHWAAAEQGHSWGATQMSFWLSPSITKSLSGLQPGRTGSSPCMSIIHPTTP